MFDLRVDKASLRRCKKYVEGRIKKIDKAKVRATNKTLTGLKTDAVKEVYRSLPVKERVKQKTVRKSFKVYNVSAKRRKGALEWPSKIEGPVFFAFMPKSGHKGHWIRKMKGGKRAGRLPIRELKTTEAVDTRGMHSTLQRRGLERYRKNLESQIAYEFGKK